VRREDLPPLDLAGATDGGVIRKLFEDAKHEFGEEKAEAFREYYLRRLRERMHGADFAGRLLQGVAALLSQLQGANGFAIGLLTGNLRRGAQIKLERFDIAHHFVDGGFGDDGVQRNDLGPVAVRRMEERTGRSFTSADVIVIGDTPKDIACARAMGARCLAVATGRFNRMDLSVFTPWMVLEDLSDLGGVLKALQSQKNPTQLFRGAIPSGTREGDASVERNWRISRARRIAASRLGWMFSSPRCS
jgi:phosphoglycolate phosphatase-like HAD superfamily hydrolase